MASPMMLLVEAAERFLRDFNPERLDLVSPTARADYDALQATIKAATERAAELRSFAVQDADKETGEFYDLALFLNEVDARAWSERTPGSRLVRRDTFEAVL